MCIEREGEEHRLRVLRGIFGPKRDEVTGGWRKLHNEEPHNLYSSPSIIRMIKSRSMKYMIRACSTNRVEEEWMKDIDGRCRRKETTRKTKT
jgi:hypothetical protein